MNVMTKLSTKYIGVPFLRLSVKQIQRVEEQLSVTMIPSENRTAVQWPEATTRRESE
jgi:hypothetical protein